MGGHHLHELHRPGRAQLPVDGRDQVAVEPPVGLDVGHASEDAGEHRGVLDAHLEVRLGAEEQLHVAGAAVGAALQALVGDPPEVGLGLYRPAHQRVDEQEVGQAVVLVQVGDLVVGGSSRLCFAARDANVAASTAPSRCRCSSAFGICRSAVSTSIACSPLPVATLSGSLLRAAYAVSPDASERESEPPAVSSPTFAGVVSKSRREIVYLTPIIVPRFLELRARRSVDAPTSLSQ